VFHSKSIEKTILCNFGQMMLEMHYHILSILCAAWLFNLQQYLTWAQETVQQALWVVPNGNLSDLSQTFTAGTTLALSWNAWQSNAYIDPTKTLVDLWVTAFDIALNTFSELLSGTDCHARFSQFQCQLT
jgi:hypothetical protein